MPVPPDHLDGLEDAPQDSTRQQLVLDLDLSGECLSGTVRALPHPDRTFTGWLGLLSALEARVGQLRGAAPGTDGTTKATKAKASR